ncbi:MAG: hypothetical protein AUH85_13595 [Chloroflexi bacterium 13_1_40CM_4_68_4]|nr:MAG: hypothetical protein AUH85_13595 [Chloroflexi bacterium 13_1_40CM_4_68_4]
MLVAQAPTAMRGGAAVDAAVRRRGNESQISDSLAGFERCVDLVLSAVAHQWPQFPHRCFCATRCEHGEVSSAPSTILPSIVEPQPAGHHQLACVLYDVAIRHVQFHAYLSRSTARAGSKHAFAFQ